MARKRAAQGQGLFSAEADAASGADPGIEARRQEFWVNVWDHTLDEFQATFDKREALTQDEIERLKKIVKVIHEKRGDAALGTAIVDFVSPEPESRLATLLQLVGGTRAKLCTDVQAMAKTKGVDVSTSSPVSIFRDKEGRALAIPYLAFRLIRVLGPLATEGVGGALEALNQATFPGYIRQQRAKMQGHEGESRLARVLHACGIPFEPEEKLDNPMCRDKQVHGVSFDLVVPNGEHPRICVKATVHTANIGQYGESKDALEVDEARTMLDKHFPEKDRPILLGLIDGVGFKSNTAGLSGVLKKTDEFCQFRTLWKAVVIACRATGRTLRVCLPRESIKQHREFLKRYNYEQYVIEAPEQAGVPKNGVPAGEATVLLS